MLEKKLDEVALVLTSELIKTLFRLASSADKFVVLALIILVVACDPARLEVMVFTDDVKLLLIFKLVTVKLVTVVVANVLVPVTVSVVVANILPAFKLEE
jgi:hypothetical protein